MKTDTINIFLDRFIEEFSMLGVDVSKYQIDHIAYQASSSEDYDKQMLKFGSDGDLFREAVVGNRRVGIWKLHTPLIYHDYEIEALEVIEPKQDQECESGFNHVEFVINTDLKSFAEKYNQVPWDLEAIDRDIYPKVQLKLSSGMGVKFHVKSVLDEDY